ncbi:hypothetical protein C0993_000656, partial [Termitomyces sp. T159_Od127]
IFESVSSGGLVENLSASSSEVSPPKRKVDITSDSPPSTPSPKKKRLTASSSMDTPVLRSRTMMEKALQSSPSKKTSTITRVYPAVKEESITPINLLRPVAGGLPDLADSPLSVLDSDDDDLPVVPRIYKQSSTKSSSGIDSSFVNVEAACEDDDQPLEPPGNNL